MGVRLIWYGCQPASMGVSTPTVEYNYPPMAVVCVYLDDRDPSEGGREAGGRDLSRGPAAGDRILMVLEL